MTLILSLSLSLSVPAGEPADPRVRSGAALAPARWGDGRPTRRVDSGMAQAALRRPAHQSENGIALGSPLTRPVATRFHAVGLPQEPGLSRQACYSAAAEGCQHNGEWATTSKDMVNRTIRRLQQVRLSQVVASQGGHFEYTQQ